MTWLELATDEERAARLWFLVDPSRPMDACSLGVDGEWVDPSNDYARLFRDEEITMYHLEPGWVWQEHDR